MTCVELADVAAELALGALTGRARAEAVAHLEACETCRELIRRLLTTADELPGLLPARDPPPEFEAAMMAWIDRTAPRLVRERSGPMTPGRPVGRRFLRAAVGAVRATARFTQR